MSYRILVTDDESGSAIEAALDIKSLFAVLGIIVNLSTGGSLEQIHAQIVPTEELPNSSRNVRGGGAPKEKKDHPWRQEQKTPRGEPKPCCGSKGARHMKNCPGNVMEKRPDPVSNRETALEIIPPIKYVEIKGMNRNGLSAEAIAEKKNLDLDEVELALDSESHAEYLASRN